MKKILVYIVITLLPFCVLAQNNLLFSQANEAYNKGNYQAAVDLYKKIEETGNVSAELYYNMANCYYKLQHVAPTVYHYEKALALKPNDADILNNYQFAQNMRIDKIDALPEGFLSRAYGYLTTLFSADTWAWMAVIFVVLFVITFIFFYRAGDSLQRKLFFGGWTLSAFLALFSVLFAFQTENYKNNNNYGIVYSEEVNIQSEPNLRSETLFKLHEGAKVKIMENIEDWNKIKLSDGKIGWMPIKELKKI